MPTVAEPLQPCFGKLWAAGCGTLEGRSPRARGPRARAPSAGTARREEYKWALSMPQVKAAFMDSQNRDDMSAAQADS